MAIEAYTHANQGLNALWCLLHQKLNRLVVAQSGSRLQGIGKM
jgi:hypothetical protein